MRKIQKRMENSRTAFERSSDNVPTNSDIPIPNMNSRERLGNNDQIFEFIQEYVNEQAMNCVTLVCSKNRDATCKFDQVDWMLRNTEFISPK